MKKHSWIMYLVGAILLGALVWLVHTRVHFQWSVFRDQLQHVDWRRIILAVAMMLFCYWLRAVRWAVLIRPQKKVSSFSLLGSQVIGFTAVALFGRLADLVRPYLVARRTKLTMSSQVAVYTVERMFDLGAMALIFSGALLLAPDRATLPHHEALQHAAMGGLVAHRWLWLSSPSVCALRAERLPAWRRSTGLPLASARPFGRHQDPRLSRWSRFHRYFCVNSFSPSGFRS